jgi:hypothetical protein
MEALKAIDKNTSETRTKRQEARDRRELSKQERDRRQMWPGRWPHKQPRTSPKSELPLRIENPRSVGLMPIPESIYPGILVYVGFRQTMPTRDNQAPDGVTVWRLARLLNLGQHSGTVQFYDTGEIYTRVEKTAINLILHQ